MTGFSAGADLECVVQEFGRLEISAGVMLHHQELRFLRKFMCCLTTCGEATKNDNLASAVFSFQQVLKQIKGGDLAPFVLQKFKAEISNLCAVSLESLKSMSCSSDEILEFIDSVIGNLKDLVISEADVVVSVKNQIIVVNQKISFLRDFVDFSDKRCTEHLKLELLLDYVKAFVENAACLSLLCFLEGEDENMAERFETMLSDLLQKMKPCAPDVGMLFGILKASKPSRSDKHLVGEMVAGLADFLLEDTVDPLKGYVQLLKEGFIFMIAFCMDPPEEAETNPADHGIFSQVSECVDEVQSFISSFSLDPSKVEISSVLCKIEKIKVEVGDIFVEVPNPADFNFSKTNCMGFLDFFLEDLMEMKKRNPRKIAFAKGQVMVVEDGLLYLKPFLKDIMELQEEEDDLKDLWKRIINTVFLAEHAIASCLLTDHPIWYDMLHLSNVIQEIKLIEAAVKTHMSNRRASSSEVMSSHSMVRTANPSSLQEAVVGWKDELKAIVDKLTRGTAHLEIVSIVGMPGLGKTTLAKKVYSDSSSRYYFNRRAWCCVSQVYKPRDLYLDFLTDVTGADARKSDSSSSDYDLAEKLRKSLKGRRYLIVLDDIWNVEAWESIKGSFPDDSNGSRIMFTSRIHNLVSQVKHNCCPHPLRSLSDDESWELLQDRLFQKNSCPPDDLARIGKNIARNCKGLPLAVVLIAGILAGKEIDFWRRIEERTSSQVVSEGCMDILELSYKNLPDYLKPCFLYFGTFPEDKIVRARKLMSLWIAEGLVPKVKGKSRYEVAESYLSDLIDRSLIILAARSSNGGIKACRVHDLLRDLCLAKIQEDNFLQCVHDRDVSNDHQGSDDNTRLCIHAEWPKFVDSKPSGSFVHSLILLGEYPGCDAFPCPSALFRSFKLLYVLDLECILIGGPFPEEVTLMVHLRYLAIWCHATKIPDSIANLWNLETLILIGSAAEIPLPRTIWQMCSLRHLHIPSLYLSGLADHDRYCQLEHLDIFSTPHLDSGNDTKELLTRLPGLRKLKCNFLERHSGEKPYKFPELSTLSGLESLKVFSYGIVFYGEKRDKFPSFDFPRSLRRLTLGRFTLPWTAISVIGQLPNLEVLKLRSRAFSGKKWEVEEGEFSNLKWLELRQLDIQEWSIPDEAFPSLEQLRVTDCYNLGGIPSSLGYIDALKKIEMRWCFQASASAREILQEQLDMANDVLEVIIFD